MSVFEQAAVSWYMDNASGWAARVGIIAAEFMRQGLEGKQRDLFLRAMQKIEKAINDMTEKDRQG
jgi:2-methylcitrate dehydratase PrpD